MREEFDKTMRFWFGLGVDGFRIDVAHGLAKADGLPDVGSIVWPPMAAGGRRPSPLGPGRCPRHLPVVALAGGRVRDPRVFVAEAWVHNPERLAHYVRADELHTAFNFDFLLAPWEAVQMRDSIVASLDAHDAVGAPPTWVLSNHDTVREVSRYARPQDVRPFRKLADLADLPADFALGHRRARAAALLMLALPGGAYVYQGEELGLRRGRGPSRGGPAGPGVGTVRPDRTGPRRVPGADPVVGQKPSFGFSPDGRHRTTLASPAAGVARAHR